MAIGAMTHLYERLGRRYPFTFLAVELQSALLVVAGTLALFTFYLDGDWNEYLLVLAIALLLTELAIITTLIRALPLLTPLSDWIGGERDPDATQEAWSAAISMPLHLVKRDLPPPMIASAIPACIAGVWILDLSWLAIFPLLFVAAVAMGYAAMLHYLAIEAGMRPLLVDINADLSPRKSADFWAVPLRTRLLVSLPLINLITGLVVAALTADGGGDRQPRPRRAGRAAGRDHDLARAHGDAVEVDPAPDSAISSGRSSGCARVTSTSRCR